MAIVEASGLTYAYGGKDALRGVDLSVPEGAFQALLGPNGSGKTTLMQLLLGVRRPDAGRVSLLGVDSRHLGAAERGRIAYVAEGQQLPGWMTLEQLEAYLAPLYPRWDGALARDLRDRFALDPKQRVGALSRGERMKAALLCALAPRPRLLLMDEPFTGMDVLVKDDLVRGLLAAAGEEGWTVVVSSHDINELELLADRAAVLVHGRMVVSESMERLRARFRRVTLVGDERAIAAVVPDVGWLAVERHGRRLELVLDHDMATADVAAMLRARVPGAERVEVREATLREILVALARDGSTTSEPRRHTREEAA